MPATSRMRSLLALPFVLLALLATTVVATPEAHALTRAQRIQSAVNIAVNQIGDPYRWGAAGPDAFDCSGLLYYSYRRAGFTLLPRTSDAQARFARPISRGAMRPGDLMFFHNNGDVYHVAIFLGWRNGRRVMLHSPRWGQRLSVAVPWTNSWFARTLR